MKVMLFNGSPHHKGCTYTALTEVESELNKCGIDTEHFWIGAKPTMGCIACGKCLETKRCFYDKDRLNEFLDKVSECDGFVFGTPIYYAGISGQLKSFLDRTFYGKSALFKNKVAAAIVSCRRGGAIGGWEDVTRFFGMTNMPIATSQYWNQVHGNTPDEVRQDKEGLQTMRRLAQNMAWMLKCIEAGRRAGVPEPVAEPWTPTNFIR
jgi:multimeric flavodoxin WrbA